MPYLCSDKTGQHLYHLVWEVSHLNLISEKVIRHAQGAVQGNGDKADPNCCEEHSRHTGDTQMDSESHRTPWGLLKVYEDPIDSVGL